jgi:hypothetical protein
MNHLPVIKTFGCMEDSLIYKIVFRSSEHSRSDFEVNGYSCDTAVQSRGPGKFVTRRDSTSKAVIYQLYASQVRLGECTLRMSTWGRQPRS